MKYGSATFIPSLGNYQEEIVEVGSENDKPLITGESRKRPMTSGPAEIGHKLKHHSSVDRLAIHLTSNTFEFSDHVHASPHADEHLLNTA
jgi:hypothetical protein